VTVQSRALLPDGCRRLPEADIRVRSNSAAFDAADGSSTGMSASWQIRQNFQVPHHHELSVLPVHPMPQRICGPVLDIGEARDPKPTAVSDSFMSAWRDEANSKASHARLLLIQGGPAMRKTDEAERTPVLWFAVRAP